MEAYHERSRKILMLLSVILCSLVQDAVAITKLRYHKVENKRKIKDPPCGPHTIFCDVKLTYEQAQYWYPERADEWLKDGLVQDVKDQNVGARGTTAYWLWGDLYEDDAVVIPYTIDTAGFHEDYVAEIEEAMAEIETLTKVVKFLPKEDISDFTTGMHSIHFQPAFFCNSYIGSVFEDQEINIMDYIANGGTGCAKGSIIHEILHALGIMHEQVRPDRDEYVTINFENIDDSAVFNFEMSDLVDSLGTEYDYGSVMHYGTHSFSSNGGATIDANGNDIGQRDGMSDMDIIQVRLLYQCSTGPRDYDTHLSKPCTKKCKCGLDDVGCGTKNSKCKGSLKCVDKTCVEETQAPTPSPVACVDDPDYRHNDKNARDCDWVIEKVRTLKNTECDSDDTDCKQEQKTTQCNRSANYSGASDDQTIGDFCVDYCQC